MYNKNINMKLLRESKGLSRAEMGKIVGCSSDLIYLCEKIPNEEKGEANRELKKEKLRNLLNYFRITEEEFTNTKLSDKRAKELADAAPNILDLFPSAGEMAAKVGNYSVPDIVTGASAEKFAEEIFSGSMLKKHNHVGKIIDDILTKHNTNRTNYAKGKLKMTYRSLSRIVSGETIPDIYQVIQIAEDHGESLDLFRAAPLPPGHFLNVIREKEALINQQKTIIDTLTELLKNKS